MLKQLNVWYSSPRWRQKTMSSLENIWCSGCSNERSVDAEHGQWHTVCLFKFNLSKTSRKIVIENPSYIFSVKQKSHFHSKSKSHFSTYFIAYGRRQTLLWETPIGSVLGSPAVTHCKKSMTKAVDFKPKMDDRMTQRKWYLGRTG